MEQTTRSEAAWSRWQRSWELDSRATLLAWHCNPRPWAIAVRAAGRQRGCRPTHFISVPLTASPLLDRFQELRSSIMRQQQLGDCGCTYDVLSVCPPATSSPPHQLWRPSDVNSGIDESLFMSANKLHLTLLILSLPSNVQLESARRLLASLQPRFQNIVESITIHTLPSPFPICQMLFAVPQDVSAIVETAITSTSSAYQIETQ